MGTKVYCKSHMSGYYYSMRDLNEDSSSSSCPSSYGDKATTNGQCHNGFMQKIVTDGYIGYGKDALKQKMLEHEAVFKSQVYELHRLYRIQRDLMEEFKRKGVLTEPTSSSSRRGSQMPYRDPHRCDTMGFPLLKSSQERTSHSRLEIENSPMSCTKGYNTTQPSNSPFQNVSSLKEIERPPKLSKKLFDLQPSTDECVNTEEEGRVSESDMSGHVPNMKGGHEITKLSLSGGVKGDWRGVKMVDLNEPFEVEESVGPSTVDFLDCGGKTKGESCPGSCKNNLSFSTPGPRKENMPILSHPATGMHNQAPGLGQGPGPGPLFSFCFSPGLGRGPGPGPLFSSCFFGSQSQSSHLQTSAQMIGEKWLVNPSSKSNPVSESVVTEKNGYYHGSSSKSNHFPGFDNLNCCRPTGNALSNRSTNRLFGQLLKSPSCLENSKPVIDFDLNEDNKSKQTLPWLTDLNQPSSDSEILTMEKIETAETRNGVKKLLGFPIFQTGLPQNVPAIIDCSQNVCVESKNRAIDINLECEPEEDRPVCIQAVQKGKMEKRKGPLIDLNSCNSNFIEECSILAPALEIDLEALVENPDGVQLSQDKNEASDDEILRNAAGIMVAISSSSPLAESLMWLAGQLEAHGPDTLAGLGQPHDEMDDFEALTLQIEETKEDYFPVPLDPRLPQNPKEEVGPACGPPVLGQLRRGQRRRGRRQRRDFRRDILPGLASLSRHEVTEDIQTFSGLMRATGHHWALGSGRRRRAHTAEDQVNREEGGLEGRSLKGWGKTTRRPRRLRWPAGNSSNSNGNNTPAVVLS